MSDLGAISSYALAMQNVQMSLLKNAVEAQQQAVEILLNPTTAVLFPLLKLWEPTLTSAFRT